MIDVLFGYLQEPSAIDWSAGTIRPLDDIVSTVELVQTHKSAYGNWFYPPLEQAPRDSDEKKDAPLIPTTNFSLPATHLLSFKSQDWTDEGANFIIALFGMLKGRRLQREEWQHFYKMPLAPMPGCDFNADKWGIASALEKASEFWLTHTDPDIRKLAFGALHWHLFAQLYPHGFERFNAQYMALDACYKLAKDTKALKKCEHYERPSALCDLLGVPTPVWANVAAGQKTCALSVRRNALAHEAMYGGQPVGFSHPADHKNMEYELTLLVARLLLRLLGIENEYTRSPCTTYQTIGFNQH
jgi:hypothetical protein